MHRPFVSAAVVACFAGALGCASAPPRDAATPEPILSADGDLGKLEEEGAAHEERVLRALAAGDPTFALRIGLVPLLGGPDAEVEADWLAARTRVAAVGEAETLLGAWAEPARLPRAAAGKAWALRLERELVIRAVREERFRVDHESALPRAASDLVRAIVMAAAGAAEGEPVRAHERWIGRRLEEIRASLRAATLDATELAELDDALDPVERGAPPATTAALARLRVDLAATRRGPPRAANAGELEQATGAHLGISFPMSVIRSRLERAEAAARDSVRAHAARLGKDELDAAEHDAEHHLFRAAPCGAAGDPSRIRRAFPPPERAAACASVRALAASASEVEAHTLLVSRHDHLVVALWAIALRGEGAEPDAVEARIKLLALVPPERRARYLRLAAVRPVTAIAAGLAAEMLDRRGLVDARAIAKAWEAFGDAPLDVIEREVLAKMP